VKPPRESPKALDAERALLGGLIEEPERLADVDALSADLAADLASEPHRMLYRLLRAMVAEGAAIDLVTVVERVRPTEGAFGGLGYVMDLPSACTSTVNLEHYAKAIVERARMRRLLAEGEALTEAATTGAGASTELATATAARLLEVVEGSESRGWSEAWEGGADVIDRIDAIREGSTPPGLAFGLPSVDEHFPGGLEDNSYTMFLGRPGKGKTAGMLQLTDRFAERGVRCAVFSLEMSRLQVFQRTLARMTRVPLACIRSPGDLSEGQLLRLRNAAALLRQWPLHIDDTPGISIQAIRSKVRGLRMKRPDLKVIAVDYIQKVGNDARMDTRERIEEASWGLRMLGAEYGFVVLSAAQLSRKADDVPIPGLSMIEHCSSLEQDVTCAIAITRPLPNDARTNEDEASWHIIKNRNGSNEVSIGMRWDGPTNAFHDPRGGERPMDAGGSLLDQVGQPGGKVRQFPPRGR
jgi:replicative DNA helicase